MYGSFMNLIEKQIIVLDTDIYVLCFYLMQIKKTDHDHFQTNMMLHECIQIWV